MTSFGDTRDYFDQRCNEYPLAGNAQYLIHVGSESGSDRRVTNLWNGATEQGAELANPVCTFIVRAAGRVTFTLGKGYRVDNFDYMLTDVEYRTGADRTPSLVLKGVANEHSSNIFATDAVTKHVVSFDVSPDHVAQDPLGAVSGGGELLECTTAFTCDPVVPYEDNKPCASDIVHGRVRVTATTGAYDYEQEKPTAAGSFIASGVQRADSDVDFMTYAFAAERGL